MPSGQWLASGVLKYVAWDDRMPVLLQPCGAVPKGTAPFYRYYKHDYVIIIPTQSNGKPEST